MEESLATVEEWLDEQIKDPYKRWSNAEYIKSMEVSQYSPETIQEEIDENMQTIKYHIEKDLVGECDLMPVSDPSARNDIL